MAILAIKILFLVIFYKLLCPKTLEKCLTAFNFTLFYTVKGPPFLTIAACEVELETPEI